MPGPGRAAQVGCRSRAKDRIDLAGGAFVRHRAQPISRANRVVKPLLRFGPFNRMPKAGPMTEADDRTAAQSRAGPHDPAPLDEDALAEAMRRLMPSRRKLSDEFWRSQARAIATAYALVLDERRARARGEEEE